MAMNELGWSFTLHQATIKITLRDHPTATWGSRAYILWKELCFYLWLHLRHVTGITLWWPLYLEAIPTTNNYVTVCDACTKWLCWYSLQYQHGSIITCTHYHSALPSVHNKVTRANTRQDSKEKVLLFRFYS